ncbi:hydroxymethylglutaryl-CoA lyase [Loktanella sp. IMCC34160]|uniref:hydroxymethylglutaryl-CoA lyase n=1 Tax=Loktanella sp. IMCC34160 TaxID=2510646 RepID=UPI00101C628E|nr:hydroxymethylglutaryl-CoA lyase [Loktanella sp. IMCC34160]RYG93214.1 hydroxymethylglutaryl-CoA lyase [Loktanella sp. IMCC34160]
MADRIRIYEVGPRDGLQNEPGVIPMAGRLELIRALVAAGLRDIEVGSFVSPRWVPQMAGSAEILAGIDLGNDVNFAALIPNMKGWEAYAEAIAPLPRIPGEVAVFISASEGFSKANLNCSVAESLDRIAPVVDAARAAGVTVRGYVSCVTDCPFDGPTDPALVARAVAGLRALAPMQVSLGDTIGRGTPDTVSAMLDAVLAVCGPGNLAGHFHDTTGLALANVEASIAAGLRTFDSSVAGLGGCPYAPGAPGNLDTGALVDRCMALGFETGVDRAALDRAADIARGLRAAA